MDHWYAECLPCKWEQTYDTEALAIAAAELHVLDHHRDLFTLSGVERGRKMAEEKIGHVQLRSENTVTAGVSTGAAAPVVEVVEPTIEEQIKTEQDKIDVALDALATLRQKQLADKKE
jgi:hypothetical protein